MKLEFFASTDDGLVRDHNEDNFVVCDDLAANSWKFSGDQVITPGAKGSVMFIADGMGGLNAGEVASHIAQETIRQEFSFLTETSDIRKVLHEVILQAHRNIVAHQSANPNTSGMGTTAVVAWLVDNMLHVAWSGDSRCYVVREGAQPAPLTDDHSLVWDLVKKNQLTPEEARTDMRSNFITQHLGDAANPPKPDYVAVPLQAGDLILLCSDGLNGMLPDEDLFQIANQQKSVPEIVRELIGAANQAGGTDNITVVAARIHETDGRTVSAPAATMMSRSRSGTRWPFVIVFAVLALASVYWVVGRNSTESQVITTPDEAELISDEPRNEDAADAKAHDSDPEEEAAAISEQLRVRRARFLEIQDELKTKLKELDKLIKASEKDASRKSRTDSLRTRARELGETILNREKAYKKDSTELSNKLNH